MKTLTALAWMCCTTLVAAPLSDSDKKSYEESKRQVQVADEACFLEPLIQGDVNELVGKIVLDAGLGSAHRALDFSEHGVQICTLEPEEEELIPYDDNLFDKAISNNIGSGLPSTVETFSDNIFHLEGLGVHCQELARVLKEEGEAILIAPASYGVLFTDGSRTEEATLAEIEAVLATLDEGRDEEIMSKLSELEGVLRATFMRRNGGLMLVSDERELSVGEEIWRIEGNKVFPSFYHTVEEYLIAFANTGLQCVEIKRPCFHGKMQYTLYHQSLEDDEQALSARYIHNSPFTIYTVIKKSDV